MALTVIKALMAQAGALCLLGLDMRSRITLHGRDAALHGRCNMKVLGDRFMNSESMLHKFVLECFQYSLTGRLGHGLVHNLNGPLQILSMQMEMMKMDIMKYGSQSVRADSSDSGTALCAEFMDKAGERVEQATEVIARLETMIQIIGYRGQDDQAEKHARPVDMAEFLHELLEFWNADLYFKHRVDKNIFMPDGAIFVNMEEAPVLSMMDGLMAAFLGCIKAKQGSSFAMRLEPGESGGCRIELEHTGQAIPQEVCARVSASKEAYRKDREAAILDCSDISREAPDLLVALTLSAVRSVDAGWEYELAPNHAVVSVSG